MNDQLVAEAVTYTLHNKHKRNFHALSGIQNRDSSNQVTSDLFLRPHSHRYPRDVELPNLNKQTQK
jgi:hypothetical protein